MCTLEPEVAVCFCVHLSEDCDADLPTPLDLTEPQHHQLLLPRDHTTCLYLTGDHSSLGNWRPESAVKMERTPTQNSSSLWSVTVPLPSSHIRYRFFISKDNLASVFSWEAGPIARQYTVNHKLDSAVIPISAYGIIQGNRCLDKGWLVGNTEIRLNLYERPAVRLINAKADIGGDTSVDNPAENGGEPEICDLSVKVLTFNTAPNISNPPVLVSRLSDHVNVNHEDGFESDSGDYERAGSTCKLSAGNLAQIKGDSHREQQADLAGEAGEVSTEDYAVFSTQTSSPEHLGFTIQLITGVDEVCLGTAILLYGQMASSHDTLTLPLTATLDKNGHQLTCVGHIIVEYTVIKPLPQSLDMSQSFTNVWTRRDQPIAVGHRGLGATASCDTEILENTILSFNSAVAGGADFIEFDVHLSKDGVPFVFHDFFVSLRHDHKESNANPVHVDTALCDLTIEQLNEIQLSHKETETCSSYCSALNHSLKTSNNRPFSLLKHCFTKVDSYAGFFIELKYPSFLQNGQFEDDYKTAFDMNYFVDTILQEILNNAGSRRIVIACFNPDICLMIRLKQNKYPVVFLCQGLNKVYPLYKDPRARNLEFSFTFARAERFLGVAPFCDMLFDDKEIIAMAKQLKLVLFSWGARLTDRPHFELLRNMGIDAIICDKIESICKNENIFKMESSRNI